MIKNLVLGLSAGIMILACSITSFARISGSSSIREITAPRNATVVLDDSIDFDCGWYFAGITNLNIVHGPSSNFMRSSGWWNDFEEAGSGNRWAPEYGLSTGHVGISMTTHGPTTLNYGGGEKEKIIWAVSSYNGSFSFLNSIASSNNVYAFVWEENSDDTSISKDDFDTYTTYYAIRLNGINSNANSYMTGVGQGNNSYNAAGITAEAPDIYKYKVVDPTVTDENGNVIANVNGVFPESFPDLVYPSSRDLAKLIPWIGIYHTSNDGHSASAYSSITDARNAYNAYSGYRNTFYNSSYVNNLYNSVVKPKSPHNFMSSSIRSYSNFYTGRSSDYTYNWWITGDLNSSMPTTLVSGAYHHSYKEEYWTNSDKRKTYTAYEAGFNQSNGVTCTWQISPDGQTWKNLCSGSKATSFQFNAFTKHIRIDNNYYNIPAICGNKSSYYIRRICNFTSVIPNSYFSAVPSPAMRIRTSIELEKVIATYTGSGVLAGTYLDPKDVRLDAYYIGDDSKVVYAGTGSYVKYDNLKIMSVGNENYVRFRFTCPLTGTVKEGYFQVKGLDVTPVSMTAYYEGETAPINTDYDPSQLRLTVTYNNGTVSVKNGNSSEVGLYKEKFSGRGDPDSNGVINSKDLDYINQGIAGLTMSDYQKEQCDINKDGFIDSKDRDRYNEITSKNISVLGTNVFYAAISGLKDPKDTSKPLYAKFNVDGTKRVPYTLYINQDPNKIQYIENEDFDPTGLIITVEYNNKTTQTISFANFKEYVGVTFGDEKNPSTKMNAEQLLMPIYYTENGVTVERDLRINVAPKTLTSIHIKQPADKFTYFSGENFDPTGLLVKAFFNEDGNGTALEEVLLSGSDYSISSGKNMQDSRDYVVIKTDNVNVNGGYERFKLSDFPNSTTFTLNHKGTWRRTNGTSVSGTVVGNYVVTISYTYRDTTKYAYHPIEVLGKKMARLDVVSEPVKKKYVAGSNFDPTGTILRASYTDGSASYIYQKTETKNGYEVIGGENLTTEQNTIIFSYTESGITCFAEVGIVVVDPSITGITAVYTGEKVVKGNEFAEDDLLIIVNYDDGSMASFRASERNADGTPKVRIYTVADKTDPTSILEETRKIYEAGYNYFAIYYSEFSYVIMVEGISDPSQVDYSSYVATTRRKIAIWSEDFKAIKVRTVADYINEAATGTIVGLANVTTQTTTDTRENLSWKTGTGLNTDANAAGKTSALLNFLREGKWRPSPNQLAVEYRARTSGFLFPEVVNPDFGISNEKETKYIDKYNQDRTAVIASEDGWGDWVSQGDSAGTVKALRRAYNYTDNNRVPDDVLRSIDRLNIRLRGVSGSDSARLLVKVEDNTGTVHEYDGINDSVTITNPCRISIEPVGDITVTYPDNSTGKAPFREVYKIYYRSTTDDATDWSSNGEWAGTSGVKMEDFEAIIMLAETSFDTGTLSALPYIAQQPSSMTILCGNQVLLSVVAVGNDLSYQWYRNGEAIPGAVEEHYYTPDLYLEDSGNMYYVVVHNSSGDTTSEKAVITVSDTKPAFTQDLDEDIIYEDSVGHTVNLSVEATCSAPELITYLWQYREGPTGEWKSLTAENTNEISVEINEGMKGRYIRCVARNGAGDSLSNYIRIVSRSEGAVTITCDTDFVTKSDLEPVKLTATAANIAGELKYTWTIDDAKVVSVDGPVISWRPRVVGTHHITVTVRSDNGEEIEGSLDLVVSPPIDVSLTKNINKTTSTVTINAAVPATEVELSYNWIFDGEKVTAASENFSLSTDNKHLSVTGLDKTKLYTVQVIIKNKTTGYQYARASISITDEDWAEE